ncbi:MAG: galactose oxidase [Planctomycetia bacterium]|nr:galactose oxidase [Planctomycetia bacterium]
MNLSCLLVLLALAGQPEPAANAHPLKWDKLPPLPDREGFASMFAGTSGGSLVVAGGANFPRGFPWEGGIKAWYDSIFILDRPDGQWRVADEKLPRPLAYGVSVTWNNAVVCIGGSDLKRHYTDVFAMRLVDGRIRFEPLPSLPEPCANSCGCLVGSTVFVAGGMSSPEATTALRTFWSLDLSAPKDKLQWKVLEPWPGLDRSHAVAASLNGSFYLISGFRWKAGEKGEPVRLSPFQTDAYRYTPKDGGGTWQRLVDVPRAVGAAPSPAMTAGASQIYVIGGIDHSVVRPDPSTHPGFPLDVFCYDAAADKWNNVGEMPAGSSRVTAASAVWQDRYLIINGERAPGRRSPDIHAARIAEDKQR